MTIDDQRVRKAVLLYLDGEVTEAEAARMADLSRAQLRQYARTCGIAAGPRPTDGSNSSTSRS